MVKITKLFVILFQYHYLCSAIYSEIPSKGFNATPSCPLSASRKDMPLRPVLRVFRCMSASCNDFHCNEAMVVAAEKGGLLHMNKLLKESGMKEVFCKFIRTKAGKIIYPKAGTCFHFFVKA